MITPSFSLTATERVLPRMALDFTTASLDSRVTFTRSGNTATVTNSSGVIAAINADLPRFDFNPTTLVCRGLLIEEARTNALLNSLIDGTDLATQLVTVTAAARTLSFYGTGTVVLSGAHSATVVGAGAYPTRTTLTFTPIAGVLTLTVTGTVQFAQLELGAFATSFIPTDGTTKTRNADVASMTGTNFSDWFNASEGAFLVWADTVSPATTGYVINVSDAGSFTDSLGIYRSGSVARFAGFVDGAGQFSLASGTISANTQYKHAGVYKQNAFTAVSSINRTVQTDNSGNVPSCTRMEIGLNAIGGSQFLNGHLSKLFYWPQSLTNAEIIAFTK
jgi:hypothetical protein